MTTIDHLLGLLFIILFALLWYDKEIRAHWHKGKFKRPKDWPPPPEHFNCRCTIEPVTGQLALALQVHCGKCLQPMMRDQWHCCKTCTTRTALNNYNKRKEELDNGTMQDEEMLI